MKRLTLALAPLLLLLALSLAFAGCGTSSAPTPATPNEVILTGSDFAQHNVTIKAGTAVHFNDPSGSGGMHVICLGQNGQCTKGASGPQALQGPGFTINAGEAKDVTFASAGTYHVTCSIHPAMNLAVTVQ